MNSVLRWLNLCAFIAMLVINALANILPLGGNTTGEVSASIPTLFTPAPFTFSIWGVIYIFMGIYVAYQFRGNSNASHISGSISGAGIWFIISCLLNIAWIFTWHYQKLGLSLLCIVGLLMSLIIINLQFTVHSDIGVLERLSIYGFNIYIGWICAATIANAGVFLSDINWTRFGLSEQFWTLLVLIAGTVLGIAFTLSGNRFMATFAIIWAYIGIFVKHMSSGGYNGAYPLIMIVIACSIVTMLIFIALAAIRPEYEPEIQY